ncbi:Sulfurtransferase uba4 [Hyphodiscus hymeniophilus]|uniref:Adenylyltransferase and sulfurtransferase uba4 n=1 Tax=Hyphodiscus hymeniophilus TaxID=353542 RepID=A0A9P6VN67_9HELO|nr:Sulfurtransferase uba4 [Hyphodiscus hymeniophilus]
MESANASAEALRKQIVCTEAELARLKLQLAQVEAGASAQETDGLSIDEQSASPVTKKWPLLPEEYKRYGRQMIVPSIGIQGQLKLKESKVLIIGAGGLGCPAAAYIAGAGVGTLGLVDGDEVEISNLHRQILHTSAKVGTKKVDSAISFLKSLNPHVNYVPHPSHLTPQNAEEIVLNYDLVLDCTDTPSSRYLISDICILLQKPLISASALRTDGQLIVLNSPPLPAGDPAGGPCYRCVFPKPPPAESVVSCGDGGIIGAVVGVMGVLQAVETIKLIVQGKLKAFADPNEVRDGKTNPASMLLFSANSSQPFRNVRLRTRRAGCFACGKDSGLSLEGLKSGNLDYVLFCGLASSVDVLNPEERISASDFRDLKNKGLLVDVREKVQFDICSLEGSINVPFSTIQGKTFGEADVGWIPQDLPEDAPIYVVCRLGNDSQVVTRRLKEGGFGHGEKRYIGDIKGGLKAWKEQVDASWPEY